MLLLMEWKADWWPCTITVVEFPEIKVLCQNQSKTFSISSIAATNSSIYLSSGDQESERNERSPADHP